MITEEDRVVYRKLLDAGVADEVCSVTVEYLDEAAVRFYDCDRNEIAAGFGSPMIVAPDGSVVLNTAEEGPRPVSIAALLEGTGIANS